MNEKRILEEKNELLKTERELADTEKKSEINLDVAKQELKDKSSPSRSLNSSYGESI